MRPLGSLLVVVLLAATGCAAPTRTVSPPSVDISGKWHGTWSGYGVMGYPRRDEASAEFVQQGARGTGRIVLHGTLAAESVPEIVRIAGAWGTRVEFEVSGDEVVAREEIDGRVFTVDLKVQGDRMVGRVRDAEPPVTLDLSRVRPPAPAQAPTPVAAAPPPAPPAPAPAPPVPPKAPEPVAAAPAEARPAPRDFVAIPEVKPIYFAFDRYDLRPADVEVLRANAEWLKANPGALVLIEGHCDERGTNEYNLALGERRARVARNFLVSQGIAAERIAIVSLGEERPACTERTEECWAKNRRDVFLVKPR